MASSRGMDDGMQSMKTAPKRGRIIAVVSDRSVDVVRWRRQGGEDKPRWWQQGGNPAYDGLFKGWFDLPDAVRQHFERTWVGS